MMHEMRRRNPKPTLLPTKGIFNIPHYIGMVSEPLMMLYVIHSAKMDCSTGKCYGNDRIVSLLLRSPLFVCLMTPSAKSKHRLLGGSYSG